MNRPIHFEILSSNPEQAASFYSTVFGWSVNTGAGAGQQYWLVTTGEGRTGIDGGIMHRHFEQAVINTIECESLEAMTTRVLEAGGRCIHGPNEIPGAGTHAYFEDPDGVLFGLVQPKKR